MACSIVLYYIITYLGPLCDKRACTEALRYGQARRSHMLGGEVEIHHEMALDGMVFDQHKHSIGVFLREEILHLLFISTLHLKALYLSKPISIANKSLLPPICCPHGRNI